MKITYNIFIINIIFILSACTSFKDGISKTSSTGTIFIESVCPIETANRFDELLNISLEGLSDCNERQKCMLNAAWLSIKKFLNARYMDEIPAGSKAKMDVKWTSPDSFELVYANSQREFRISGKSDFSKFSTIQTTGNMRVCDFQTNETIHIKFDVIEKRSSKILLGHYWTEEKI